MYKEVSSKVVSSSFANAAKTYDAAATVQQQSAQALCLAVEGLPIGHVCLDIGTGTGAVFQYLSQPVQHKIAFDIALPMLEMAQDKAVAHQYVLGNAEFLPFGSNTIDLCISNMALQWCDIECALHEIERVLKPNAYAALTLVISGTFWQLEKVWLEEGLASPVMPFVPVDGLLSQLDSSDLRLVESKQQEYQAHYENLHLLLAAIKKTGAQQYPKKSEQGLLGKKRWLALQKGYEVFRQLEGLPLSYRTLQLIVQKKG